MVVMSEQPEYLKPDYWAKSPCDARDPEWNSRLGAHTFRGPHVFREGERRCASCDATPAALARRKEWKSDYRR